jgi:hypothetical protein
MFYRLSAVNAPENSFVPQRSGIRASASNESISLECCPVEIVPLQRRAHSVRSWHCSRKREAASD